jgi:hypothetical protein
VYDTSKSMTLPAFAEDDEADEDEYSDGSSREQITEDEVRYEIWRLSKFDPEFFTLVCQALESESLWTRREECMRVLGTFSRRMEMAVEQHQLLVSALCKDPSANREEFYTGERIQIFVKGAKKTAARAGGALLTTFQVTNGMTIAQLMDAIAVTDDGCPLENQRLKFGGKFFRANDDNNRSTLAEIGVTNGSTIENHPSFRPCGQVRAHGSGPNFVQKIKIFPNIDCIFCRDKDKSIGEIECKTDEKAKLVALKIWCRFSSKIFVPADRLELWTNCRTVGDGFVSGTRLDDSECVGKLDHVYLHRGRSRHEKRKKESRLSRIETTKQLFHAFVNRCQAYNIPNQLGLILFSTAVRRSCEMTRLFEKFREHVDRSRAGGDTKLWDAILDAQAMLLEKFPKAQERPLLRILVLSDGVDSSSTAKPWQVANALLKHHIVLDAILLGESKSNSELMALVKVSNGYAFAPDTITQALELCELETVLSMNERPVISQEAWQEPGNQRVMERLLSALGKSAKTEDVGYGVAPARREPCELSSSSVNVTCALERHKDEAAIGDLDAGAPEPGSEASSRMTAFTRKRLLHEMRSLSNNPHPDVDVYPSESNLAFWKVVFVITVIAASRTL